ncbi:MAG: VOC family protein [Thermomicrobia bacterium]|nr:VOC family protein [Thermomicrobia bacterium]MCA1725409.1 VOC family protein [Thermomicrobia bacterium]
MAGTGQPRPHHLNLAGAHWEDSAAFYRDLLGLVPVELPRDREAYGATIATSQDERGYQYHFVPSDPDFAARNDLAVNPFGAGHLAFRVDDIAAVRARLDAAGIPYSDMGEWAIKGWHQLFCADPEGRVIEFHQVIAEH